MAFLGGYRRFQLLSYRRGHSRRALPPPGHRCGHKPHPRLRHINGILALVYFGGMAASEAVFRALTGQEQQPQIPVIASTLVIAALFTPLSRRIQLDTYSRRIIGWSVGNNLTSELVLDALNMAIYNRRP